jgi:hypothetical protein
MTEPKWLEWAQELHSIAQAGLTYCRDPFDRERYAHLNELAAEILSSYTTHPLPALRDILEGEQGYATPKVDARGVIFRDSGFCWSRNGWTVVDPAGRLGGCW